MSIKKKKGSALKPTFSVIEEEKKENASLPAKPNLTRGKKGQTRRGDLRGQNKVNKAI